MPDVLIVSSAHDVADARIHRIVAALRGANLGVEVRARGGHHHAPAGARFTAQVGDGWVGRGRAGVEMLRQGAAVLVVVDPELALLALLWRLLHRGAVVVDVHEDYVAVAHDRTWVAPWCRGAVAAAARMATWAAARADVTVVADDHVPPAAARRRLVVPNIPSMDELPAPQQRDPTPRAIYIGDLRASRGLFDMVRAVVATPDWSLDLVGPISDEDRRRVTEMAGAADAGERVRLHGRLPVRTAWEHAAGAWVGLALLHDTPAFREAVPTKLYEYLGSGLPVVVSPLPPLRAFIRQTGGGIVAEGPTEVAARLEEWSRHPAALDRYTRSVNSWRTDHLTGQPFDEMAREIGRLVRRTRKVST